MSYGTPQPYSSPTPGSFGPPPQKKSNTGCVVGVILGVVALVAGGGVLVCCGGGYGFLQFSVGMITSKVEQQLRANPTFAQHFGEFKKCSYNYQATGERHPPGSNRFVLDVEGTLGKGQVDVQCAPDLTVVSGTMRTPAGVEVPLVPAAGAGGPISTPPGFPEMPNVPGAPRGPGQPRS